MFINDKKVLGTEGNIPSGSLGMFAGPDDNFYVKKSDGTYYPISGANSNTNAQIVGTVSLVSGSSSVVNEVNFTPSSIIFISNQSEYSGTPASLSLYVKRGSGTFSVHSISLTTNGVIGYMIFNI